MKKIHSFVLLLILCCIAQQVIAQQTKEDLARVMIIPFDPNLYFSDADEQLSKYNEKSIKEIRTLFRYGINTTVNAKILTHYATVPLLTDTMRTAREDLNLVYRDISYFKDKSMPSEAMKKKIEEEKKTDKNPFSLKKKETESQAQVTSKLDNHVLAQEYMNVKIHQTEMLAYLQKKYGTDLFVFINQFELVTNYEHCLDRATNTFERDIKVHFSIFDATGKQLAGDVAIAHFSSNTNDITEIIRNNFPIISEYLAGNLPNKTEMPEQPAQPVQSAPPVNTPPSPPAEKEEVMEFEDGGN